MTLAQAGLRIDDTRVSEYELSAEVINELKVIIAKISRFIPEGSFNGKKDEFLSEVIGFAKLIPVTSYNEKQFASFKKEYLSILKNTSIDLKSFQLLAV